MLKKETDDNHLPSIRSPFNLTFCTQEKQLIEEENTRLNTLKIQNRWKEILKLGKEIAIILSRCIKSHKLLNAYFCLAKSDELKKEIEILRQVQSRRLDRKQAAIRNLKTYINESEDQFSNALQQHLINVDILIDLQNSRLETLKEQFQGDLSNLETEFNAERMKLQADHAKDRADILGIMARAEHEFQENEADAKHEYSSVRDDVKNKVRIVFCYMEYAYTNLCLM